LRRPGSRRIPGCASLLLCALLLSSGAPRAAPPDVPVPGHQVYLTELVDRARQLELGERREWLKLGHYEPNLVGPGYHGLVASPDFYNAPHGRTDPQAELEATLARFFEDPMAGDAAGGATGAGRQDPQCRFIARYAWLAEQLGFDATRLPRRRCPRYEAWHAALNPGGLTLVFASAYINSPASMYGHTFLRVDAADQDEQTRLLAYVISFAANTQETNGFAFAVNGLLGGYAGTFSILPYYLKVREYSDLDNRDLWEYRLQLDPRQLDRVLMHAWELVPTQFHYYFFDENCAYHLLGLLQVARPDLDLTSQFRWWAVPTDTVRAVSAHADLIASVVYRPARATRLRQSLAAMDAHERALVDALSRGRLAPNDAALASLAPERSAVVLETSQDLAGFRHAAGKSDVADAGALELELLTARSGLNLPAQEPPVPTPEVRPDEGHGSARLAVGVGRWDGQDYQEVAFRPAYHDLVDAGAGFVPGAQVEFFNASVHHFADGLTRVENLTPLRLVSLTPRDAFFQTLSWDFATGWQRVRLADGAQPLVFGLGGGGGGAWSNERGTVLGYARLEGATRIGGGIGRGYELGAGTTAGMLIDIGPRWRVHAYAQVVRDFLGQQQTPWTLGLEQGISVSRNAALRIDAMRVRDFARTDDNASFRLLLYF